MMRAWSTGSTLFCLMPPPGKGERMVCRGIRGAITADEDSPGEIMAATTELLFAMQEANGFLPDQLAAAFFTATPDLVSSFPAAAARALGWDLVPLLDATEIPVPDAQPRCIRVLLLWNCDREQSQIQHRYLRGAARLRPDLAAGDGASGREQNDFQGEGGQSR